MRRLAQLAIAVVFIVVGQREGQGQTLSLYDRFSGREIDSVLWRGFENTPLPLNTDQEIIRRVVGGSLQLLLTATGGKGSSLNRLRINHPALVDHSPLITALQARVTVTGAEAGDCATFLSGTRASAQLYSSLFNHGGNAVSGDLTGDVYAIFEKALDSKLGEIFDAVIYQCADAACDRVALVGDAIFTRRWVVGKPDVMTLEWQPGQDRVVFTVTGARGSESRTLAYEALSLVDSALPKLFAKDLRVQTGFVECQGSRQKASIDARFDNVKINANAVEAMQ